MSLARLAPFVLALAVLPVAARAHLADVEAVLDAVQEVPAPVAAAAAAGTGKFVLQADGTVNAEVTFQGLTGAPLMAHIHEGAPGVVGPALIDFTPRVPGGTSGTVLGPG